jgi:hypothetical protein
MTWSPDSSRIMYRLQQTAEEESSYFPVTEEVISIDSGIITNVFTHLRMPASETVWTPNGDLFFVRPITSESLSSSKAVWRRDISEPSSATPIAYGRTEDADGIIGLCVDSLVAVEVASGLDTRVDIIGSEGKPVTIFETNENAIVYMTWDVKRVAEGHYVFVALRSSGVTGEPENIWSGSADGTRKGTFTTKLSSHHGWFADRNAPISTSFRWTSSDGEALEGIISFPPDCQPKHLPTVVVPHVGPYWSVFYLHYSRIISHQ